MPSAFGEVVNERKPTVLTRFEKAFKSKPAEASAVAPRTIVDFERGARAPRTSTVGGSPRALEAAGVMFIAENGRRPGVRSRKREQQGDEA